MGLTADVYKHKGMSFAGSGGLSAAVDEVVVVNCDGPFEPSDAAPAVLIVPNRLGDPIAVPATLVDGRWVPARPEGVVGPMMGGCYIATSDSRFRRLSGVYGAVPLHDRFETPAQYRELSQ